MSGAKDNLSRYWERMISSQKTSGLTTVEFCRRRGISTGSFYQWRNRLGMREGSSQGESLPKAPSLVPVQLISGLPQSGITIELPNGIRLRTPDVGTAVETVRRLGQENLS